VRKALAETQAVAQVVDPEAKVRAYLGDAMLMGSAAAVLAGIQKFISEMRKLGLNVNNSKMRVWAPNPNDTPGDLLRYAVGVLTVLRSEVNYLKSGDDDNDVSAGDVPVGVAMEGASSIAHLRNQRCYFAILAELCKEELSLAHMLQLPGVLRMLFLVPQL
jgi:hypothetical protein